MDLKCGNDLSSKCWRDNDKESGPEFEYDIENVT